jgi:hypothetical protein
MARRSDIAWNAVEVDYRLGVLTVRAIAEKHGIADSNLRRKAKQEGWVRGEGDTARIAARQALSAISSQEARAIGAEIGEQQAQEYRAGLAQVVLSAVEVEREHQLAARRGMNVALRLLQELESACACADITQAEIDLCRVDDPARAALIERQLGIKGRVEAFDRWSSALSRVTAVEREAHQIGGGQKTSEIDELLRRVHESMKSSTSVH